MTTGRGISPESEWRCIRCGKLLAVLRGDRLHISFARGHEYLVGLPVTCVCRNCRTLNERQGGEGKVVSSTGNAATAAS